MSKIKDSRSKVFSNGFYHGIMFSVLLQAIVYNIQGVEKTIERLQQQMIKFPWWYHIGWPTVLISVIFLIWIYLLVSEIKKYKGDQL
jgi:hypothetical protein